MPSSEVHRRIADGKSMPMSEANLVMIAPLADAFDSQYYRSVYPDIPAEADALKHYCEIGWREGRDPNDWFSTRLYLVGHPDVAASQVNPFYHFIAIGKNDKRRIWPPLRRAQGASVAPEAMLLTEAFDADYYCNRYPDIADTDPLLHYFLVGWRELRDPSAWFSTKYYLFTHHDVAAAEINPLLHYVLVGREEGRAIGSPELSVPAMGGAIQEATQREMPGVGSDGIHLLARLSALRAEVRQLAERPFRPRPDLAIGFIEAFAVDDTDLVWIRGWMHRTPNVDFPAVIVDKQKIAASLAITLFSRDDLGPGMTGILGVVHADWRPSPASEIHLYIGENGAYLRADRPLPVLPMHEFALQMDELIPRCHSGHTLALERLRARPETWIVQGDDGYGAQAMLDHLLVLPGFGAIAEGWVLSPLRQVTGFALRLGPCVLGGEQESLLQKPRPDLATVVPEGGAIIHKAGFTVIFRGAVIGGEMSRPILKVLYADGGSSNHRIDPKMPRRIGVSADIEQALALYPSLTLEPFFADFATALTRDHRARLRPPHGFAVAQAKRCCVLVVPSKRSEVFLLFAELHRRARNRDPLAGLVLIAGRSAQRAETIALFTALREAAGLQCSLYFVDDPATALWLLPDILADLGAASFAFVAPGIFLTEAGWKLVAKTLDEGTLTLIGTEDARLAGDGEAEVSALVWTTSAFRWWIERTPVFPGGMPPEKLLCRAAMAARIEPVGARRVQRLLRLPMAAAVNAALAA